MFTWSSGIFGKFFGSFSGAEEMTLGLVRLGLPSKGRMEGETLEFLERCGFRVRRIRRQYLATIDEFPEIQIVFQRQEDIVRGVENGLLTFGIVGLDLVSELTVSWDNLVIIHGALGFGKCTLEVAVPESWDVDSVDGLRRLAPPTGDRFRVASKFPKLTAEFLDRYGIPYEFVEGAGTLEVSPALGNAEFIVDLVSTGQTLEDNRLKRIRGGQILKSEAVFIGDRERLKSCPETLRLAKKLLEIFEATLRAVNYVSVYANMRGRVEEVMPKLFERQELGGLQGPTVSGVFSRDGDEWFAIHIIADRRKLVEVIDGLRSVGGSGVVVAPALYIFEEEPRWYTQLLENLQLAKEVA